MYYVKRQDARSWGIYRDGELVEGGFSSRAAAEAYRDSNYPNGG